MDRRIPSEQRKRERVKVVIRLSAIGLGTILAFMVLLTFLERSLYIKDLDIGVVDRGVIDLTVNAPGKLTPQIEEVIVSPINTRILEVYKNTGDLVEAGEPLLKLELSSTEAEYKKMLDEKQMRQNKLIQVKIGLNNSVSELEMEQQIKEMHLKQLSVDLQNEKHLDSIGASTTDKVRKIELTYAEARLEREQLVRKIENEQKNVSAELRVQEFDLSISEKTLQQSARLLQDAHIPAPQRATLIYINNEIGAHVNAGAKIAVISDLSRFKVNAEIADGHAEKLTLGSQGDRTGRAI